MTTLLKVYIKGGLFDRSRELLSELESVGYAENEVKLAVYTIEKIMCDDQCTTFIYIIT